MEYAPDRQRWQEPAPEEPASRHKPSEGEAGDEATEEPERELRWSRLGVTGSHFGLGVTLALPVRAKGGAKEHC